MAEFSYTAQGHDGHQASGVLSAPTRAAAIASLRSQGVKPLQVKEAKAKRGGLSFGKKVKIKDLVIFTRELSTMIGAGVPLPRGLTL